MSICVSMGMSMGVSMCTSRIRAVDCKGSLVERGCVDGCVDGCVYVCLEDEGCLLHGLFSRKRVCLWVCLWVLCLWVCLCVP